jgi:probable DNA repair protein
LLDDFMSLNTLTTTMSADHAIQTLRDLAANVLFQIQKPATPVTLLGILEASGCQFDSIWIMGLTDQCLPQKTKFSPFLPISMQKNLVMPHTDAQREFQRAQLVLQRLGYASRTIVYSYPQTVSDQPQLPSALILHYPVYTTLAHFAPSWTSAAEVYQENYRHPPKIGSRFSGGTAVLASQAKCPFQAFAAHRLKIKPALAYTDGLDLAERGQILHQIMETLWHKLKQQAKLLQLSADHLSNLVQSSIHNTLQAFMATRPAGLSELTQELEYQRLTHLVHACLEWEKKRAPFQIETLEQNYEITLAGLPLKVRVDRLDQNVLQSGKCVIDYKTSLPTTKPWLEKRPEAPQLLLYALLDKQITTLIFVQMKAGRTTLQGLSAIPNDEPGMQGLRTDKSWSFYQQHWETELTQLASEIQQGYCEPNPKRGTICQNCSFHSLCRIA